MSKKVHLEVTSKNAVYINSTRITGRETKWGTHFTVFEATVPVSDVMKTLNENGYGHLNLVPAYAAEFGIIV